MRSKGNHPQKEKAAYGRQENIANNISDKRFIAKIDQELSQHNL